MCDLHPISVVRSTSDLMRSTSDLTYVYMCDRRNLAYNMNSDSTHAHEEGKVPTTNVDVYQTVMSALKSDYIRKEITVEEQFNMLLVMCKALSKGKINVKVPTDSKTKKPKEDGIYKASCNFFLTTVSNKCRLGGNLTFTLPTGLDADKAKAWLQSTFPEAEVNDTRNAPSPEDTDAVLDSIHIGV